ncbi:hypothetical protein EVAR_51090_1 [Eumeta japonica]|uniref:Uncharacterized protein n=1 Tax=Eumeta variegata TaxID=151549 RepID=A0A4C1XLV1_EUMVA|nr:hypothetical protein EVAR_51090_1 [Eumeta japonica]
MLKRICISKGVGEARAAAASDRSVLCPRRVNFNLLRLCSPQNALRFMFNPQPRNRDYGSLILCVGTLDNKKYSEGASSELYGVWYMMSYAQIYATAFSV